MLYWRGFLEAIHSCSKQGKLSRWLRAIFSEDLRISIDGEFKTTLCSLPQSPNKKFSFFLIIFFSIPTCVQCPYCASVRRAFPILSVPCYEEVISNIKVSPMTCSSQGWIDSALTVPPCTPSAEVPSWAWWPQCVNIFLVLESSKLEWNVVSQSWIHGNNHLPWPAAYAFVAQYEAVPFAARAQCWLILNFLPTVILRSFSTKQFCSPPSQVQNCTFLRKQIISQSHHRTGYF